MSYSKLAAVGQFSGANIAGVNPVSNELDWQTTQMLTQMINDVEFSFINGVYQKPSDNTKARRTRGIRQAARTRTNKGTVVGTFAATAADEKLTLTAHGLNNGDRVFIADPAAAAAVGLSAVPVYFVVNKTANDLQVSLTAGGAAVDVTANGNVSLSKVGTDKPTPDVIGAFLQSVYNAGGIRQSDSPTLQRCSSAPARRSLSQRSTRTLTGKRTRWPGPATSVASRSARSSPISGRSTSCCPATFPPMRSCSALWSSAVPCTWRCQARVISSLSR